MLRGRSNKRAVRLVHRILVIGLLIGHMPSLQGWAKLRLCGSSFHLARLNPIICSPPDLPLLQYMGPVLDLSAMLAAKLKSGRPRIKKQKLQEPEAYRWSIGRSYQDPPAQASTWCILPSFKRRGKQPNTANLGRKSFRFRAAQEVVK